MPRLDEPQWATTETAFAEWAAANDVDETDEAFALFERWLDGDPDDRDPDIAYDAMKDGSFFPEVIDPKEPW